MTSLQKMKVELAKSLDLLAIDADVADKYVIGMYRLVITGSTQAGYQPAISHNRCLIGQKTPDPSGYIKVNCGDSNDYSQRVIMRLVLGSREFEAKGAMQASHLCHNKLCLNAAHINMETPLENVARKTCVKFGFCMQKYAKNHNEVKCVFPPKSQEEVRRLLEDLSG